MGSTCSTPVATPVRHLFQHVVNQTGDRRQETEVTSGTTYLSYFSGEMFKGESARPFAYALVVDVDRQVQTVCGGARP